VLGEAERVGESRVRHERLRAHHGFLHRHARLPGPVLGSALAISWASSNAGLPVRAPPIAKPSQDGPIEEPIIF
jgi:hypothetical protein